MVRPETKTKASPLRLAASWLLVLIPLGWGVFQCVVKSLPLLQMTAAPAATSIAEE